MILAPEITCLAGFQGPAVCAAIPAWTKEKLFCIMTKEAADTEDEMRPAATGKE
ncbi:MAG TPA: hypothetical protein H9831_10785 [Candidatus Eisenbergiella pullistercoris]|uniref:Uncharacterized protein n=1 Tax=Candidatus Eisenbergiella pullistercoris TaxID=2838555 RepID=A0A9D1YRC9_9FIRM|nr:hypothetical protein [Candidatus Eisenbergiella pullistercoris]